MSGEERLINVELLNDLGGLSDNGEGNEGHKRRGLIDLDVVKDVGILSDSGGGQ
jgi:hypothetical protein